MREVIGEFIDWFGLRTLGSNAQNRRDQLIDAEQAARQFRAMGYYLIGACLEETAGYARGPSAADPVSDEFIVRECPNLMAAAPYFQERHWDATFELGIDLFMQGIHRRREARDDGH